MKRPLFTPFRKTAWLALCTAAALSAGCATAPPPAPAPAPEVQALAQYMAEAQAARGERMTVKERDTYRSAARSYPTAKEPWVRLAESYFEAADYGNAILAAQEVLQRDGADTTAAGILAVSGLRVSTLALQTLRTQNTGLPGDTRSQAEGLARTLREVLGETVLVPKPGDAQLAATPAPAAASAAARRPPVRLAARPPAAASTPAPTPASTPSAAPTVAVAGAAAAPKPVTVTPTKATPPKNPFADLK